MVQKSATEIFNGKTEKRWELLICVLSIHIFVLGRIHRLYSAKSGGVTDKGPADWGYQGPQGCVCPLHLLRAPVACGLSLDLAALKLISPDVPDVGKGVLLA